MMSITVVLRAITSTLPLPARAAQQPLKAFFTGGVEAGLGQGLQALDPVQEVRLKPRKGKGGTLLADLTPSCVDQRHVTAWDNIAFTWCFKGAASTCAWLEESLQPNAEGMSRRTLIVL